MSCSSKRCLLFSFSLFVAVTLSGCPDPQPDCNTTNFWPCTERAGILQGATPSQADSDYIAFGDSIPVGGKCLSTCGFIDGLETATGKSVANFGIAGHTAHNEVDGWLLWGDYKEPFWRVQQSISLNPNATRAYIHIGGDDLIDCRFGDSPPASCHDILWPNDPPDCSLDAGLEGFIASIADKVRLIVQTYKANGISDIYLFSPSQIDPDCAAFLLFIPDENERQCINPLLLALRDALRSVATEEGTSFVDLTADQRLIANHCANDCIHIDCQGHALVLEDILAAD